MPPSRCEGVKFTPPCQPTAGHSQETPPSGLNSTLTAPPSLRKGRFTPADKDKDGDGVPSSATTAPRDEDEPMNDAESKDEDEGADGEK